jgi:predicted DNA-binding protein (MmcQ/YjbR family)
LARVLGDLRLRPVSIFLRVLTGFLFSEIPPGHDSSMTVEWVRSVCLSCPYATEHVQWGNNLVFKVGGKMFAVVPLDPAPVRISFKTSPEEFAELIERPGVIPAPYLARAYWVALETDHAIPRSEFSERLKTAYDLVFSRLPAKTRAELLDKTKPRGRSAKATRRGSV